jgi:hypothetical protein
MTKGRGMSLEELVELVPPPRQPFEVGTLKQWRAVEKKLGTELPLDYREVVFAYGSGLFAEFYRVYNPFAVSEHIKLVPSAERVCRFNRESRSSFPMRFPYPYFPEPGGLLPWGNDVNGNDYFWLTEGPPSAWVVVQDENRGGGIKVQPYSMTGFLVAVLTRKVKALASGYPAKSDRIFEQWGKGQQAGPN